MRAPRPSHASTSVDRGEAPYRRWMDAAGLGGSGTPEASARRGKFEAMGKQMRLVFLPGDDANMTRLGDEVAAAIPRPFGREIAFLHTEGPALICNPVDQAQYPR